jgi:hypothetical protein
MTVYVYLWFDIEDYVTRESDGLVLTALDILRKYKIPVTCKVVAEKTRALLAHGRNDVIAAISECDVGYHLDTHSRHPTVYEYLAEENVVEGADDFYARESSGLQLVRRTFKTKPSCFGHPGSAWAPHFYPALKKMGIPVYLDETSILNVGNAPYWYCGVLNLNGANKNFVLFDRTFEDPEGIAKVKARFNRIHEGLKEGGGLVSILFHLHTAINTKFWDEVNFGKGKNRSPKEYIRPPPQPQHVTERAWKDFDEFMRYVSSFEDVRFITARDAQTMYKRTGVIEVDRTEMGALAESSRRGIDCVICEGSFFSPAQIFYAVTKALREYKEFGSLPSRLTVREPLGPLKPWNSKISENERIPTERLLAACAWAVDFVDSKGYMPDSVRLTRDVRIAPADFLSTASSCLSRLLRTGRMPATVPVVKGRFLATKHVDEERFRLACRWNVLPPRFNAPGILEQIKLQTWTLVPAGPPVAPKGHRA